jgi:hypothetical protein
MSKTEIVKVELVPTSPIVLMSEIGGVDTTNMVDRPMPIFYPGNDFPLPLRKYLVAGTIGYQFFPQLSNSVVATIYNDTQYSHVVYTVIYTGSVRLFYYQWMTQTKFHTFDLGGALGGFVESEYNVTIPKG